jgi:hypothetical protein
VSKLPESAQVIPFRPRFSDDAVRNPIDRHIVTSQNITRWRVRPHLAVLSPAKAMPDGYPVLFRQHVFNRLKAIGKDLEFAARIGFQIFPPIDRRCSITVAYKVGIDEFVKPLPVPCSDGLRKCPDNLFMALSPPACDVCLEALRRWRADASPGGAPGIAPSHPGFSPRAASGRTLGLYCLLAPYEGDRSRGLATAWGTLQRNTPAASAAVWNTVASSTKSGLNISQTVMARKFAAARKTSKTEGRNACCVTLYP